MNHLPGISSSSLLMQLQILTNTLGRLHIHRETEQLNSTTQLNKMVATTSSSASTSRQPTLRREVHIREVTSTELNLGKLEGKQSDKDMLGSGSSVRTLSLCSDDFEDIECNENRPEQVLRSPLKTASSSHIRSRFLNSLGISRPAQAQTEQHPKRISSGPCSGSFVVTLKADHGKTDNPLSELSSSLITVASSNTSMRRGVTFDADVTVHPIPRFSRYSDRVRAALWTPSAEVQANAARNCHEFAAEGWNWRHVAVDEDMILYRGELIHPVHFVQEQECSMRQQFLQVMSARNR
jgi:hypothetical protein